MLFENHQNYIFSTCFVKHYLTLSVGFKNKKHAVVNVEGAPSNNFFSTSAYFVNGNT